MSSTEALKSSRAGCECDALPPLVVQKLTLPSTYHALGRCLWKMYNCDDEIRGSRQAPHLDEILDVLANAIKTLPQRKDNRYDPIIEPHYKIISVIHKLVTRGMLTVRCLNIFCFVLSIHHFCPIFFLN